MDSAIRSLGHSVCSSVWSLSLPKIGLPAILTVAVSCESPAMTPWTAAGRAILHCRESSNVPMPNRMRRMDTRVPRRKEGGVRPMPAPDTRRVPAGEPWAAGSAYSMYVQGIDLNETTKVSNRATKTK